MNLPAIAFGTSPYRANGARADLEEPVRIALASGYRRFDLAEMYGNERAVGRALRGAGAPPRSELHLIGKVWRTNLRPEHLRRACEDSLRRIGVDSFDLYLLHAPDPWRHVAPLEDPEEIGWEDFVRRGAPHDENGMALTDDVPLRETWEAMGALRAAGLTAQTGVSNFTHDQIAALVGDRPDANEVPCWPVAAPALDGLAWPDITVLGYSPLRPDLLEAPLVRAIAASHERAPAAVVLRWLMDRGINPITSSINPRHIRESLCALDLVLEASETSALTTALS